MVQTPTTHLSLTFVSFHMTSCELLQICKCELFFHVISLRGDGVFSSKFDLIREFPWLCNVSLAYEDVTGINQPSCVALIIL